MMAARWSNSGRDNKENKHAVLTPPCQVGDPGCGASTCVFSDVCSVLTVVATVLTFGAFESDFDGSSISVTMRALCTNCLHEDLL